MNEKVSLPKSTKKVYYQIFREISILDIAVFTIFIGFSLLISLVVPLTFLLKILISLMFLSLGFLIIQKDKNELRMYEFVFRFIKYIAIGFWKPAIDVTPNFVKVESKEVLKFKHLSKNLFLCGIKIESTNLQLLNENQQLNLIGVFANLLKAITLPCKIIKTNVNYSFEPQLEWLNNKTKLTEIQKKLISLQRHQLQEIESSKLLSTAAVYILWIGKDEEEAQKQLKSVLSSLVFSNLQVKMLTNQTLLEVWRQFTFKNHNIKATTKKIKFKDKNNGFVWSINNFPKQINFYWLNQLFSLENLNVCVNLNPINKIKAQKQLDNAINKIETNANYYAKTTSQRQKAEQYKEAFLTQQQAITDDIDVLKDISIFVIASGKNKVVGNVKRELKDLSLIMGWKYDNLHYLQNQAVIATYGWKNFITKESCIEMTCETFATSFPIPDMPLNDKKGFLMAETISGKPVFWDLFLKDSQRRNQNLLILGESGSGKSFTAKKIILNQTYRNSKIFILDPENEFNDLTENLNGQVIDASGSKGNFINPFEIYKLKDDDDNADSFNNQLALFESFFSLLFPKLIEDNNSMILLIELIKETYKAKKIFPSTDFTKLKRTDFPIFSDLLNLINKKIKNKTYKEQEYILENLKSKLISLTQGTYAKYWNGYTKFQWSETSIVTFNLRELFDNTNKKIINLQMLLILRLLSEEISAIKNYNDQVGDEEQLKILVAVDETHLLANENNPIALDFLFHTMKRIRKCNGSLIVITQNCNDFTGSEAVRKKFTGIINNCQYSLIGGMQPDDLNSLEKIYKQVGGLSDAVKNFIGKATMGLFWFKISKQEQLPIQVLQIDEETKLIKTPKEKEVN